MEKNYKTCLRFFGENLLFQEMWLNRMSSKGYRLINTGTLLYDFVKSEPDEYEYKVEYIGNKNKENSEKYKYSLEKLCYSVMYKNAILYFALGGAIRYKPYAEKGGRFSTEANTLSKELLIIEKKKDDRPFKVETLDLARIEYFKTLRNIWLLKFVLFMFIALIVSFTIFNTFWICLLAIVFHFPIIGYQVQMNLTKKKKR